MAQEPVAHQGTQGETEAEAGHAVQLDVVTADIAAPAQDEAVALQNRNEM